MIPFAWLARELCIGLELEAMRLGSNRLVDVARVSAPAARPRQGRTRRASGRAAIAGDAKPRRASIVGGEETAAPAHAPGGA